MTDNGGGYARDATISEQVEEALELDADDAFDATSIGAGTVFSAMERESMASIATVPEEDEDPALMGPSKQGWLWKGTGNRDS